MKKFAQATSSGLIITLALVFWFGASQAASNAPQDKQADKTATKTKDARALYGSNCATCHGKNGRAKTFKAKLNHARDLTDVAWQAEVTDERIYNSIANGRGKMPAFGKKFSPQEIESVAAYVRSLKK
ncbi:MAG: cytochrome c [Acidobacteria bacterium]|nr:cytochrome c [Acidobacteriota bacterium]